MLDVTTGRNALALLALLALLAAACGDVPSLGTSRCDYELAACSEEYVDALEPSSWPVPFDVHASRSIGAAAQLELGSCGLDVLGCNHAARVLPGPDGDVWVAYEYWSADGSADDPWLVRVGPDGEERERVARGAELLGAPGDVSIGGPGGEVALLRGARSVERQDAQRSPVLFVRAPDGEQTRTSLAELGLRGEDYASPALLPDGSLRLRERRQGESPTSIVVVATESSGALRWRKRYSPAERGEDRFIFAAETSDEVLEALREDAPRSGFVFDDGSYGLLSSVERGFFPEQALVTFDEQGSYIGAIGGLQQPGEQLMMASNGSELAYARRLIADRGAGLSVYALRAGDITSTGHTPGRVYGGRRVDYYSAAPYALAVGPSGDVYTVSVVGAYQAPRPVICRMPADGGRATCSELELCTGERDRLVWPDVAPGASSALTDGTALVQGDELAFPMRYVCADASTAAFLSELTYVDLLLAASDVEQGKLVPIELATLTDHVEAHDALMLVDLAALAP